MKKLGIYVTLICVMLTLSVVTPSTIVSTLPSCVTIMTSDGVGSGFIIMPGYIVTAKHVVENEFCPLIQVKLFRRGKLETPTEVINIPNIDISILKVDTHNYPAVHFGNSDALKPGDEVYAVGAPYNLIETVTKGIVASYRRKTLDVGTTHYDKLIETSGSVTIPGDSGGPLCNNHGQVVGICVLALNSIGFVIPIDSVRHKLMVYVNADVKAKETRKTISSRP